MSSWQTISVIRSTSGDIGASTGVRIASPCRSALCRARSLPDNERGPVLLFAFGRLASRRRSEIIVRAVRRPFVAAQEGRLFAADPLRRRSAEALVLEPLAAPWKDCRCMLPG